MLSTGKRVAGTMPDRADSASSSSTKLDAPIRRILDFPHVGARVPRVPGDLPVRRLAVTRFPYHVIYLEPAEALRILAIAHDRRKPGYWKDRLK